MPILERDHYTAFGFITHFYASVEFGIRAAIAGILDVPFVEALIITEPYSASTFKNVAKSLTKESSLSDEHKEQLIQIVGDWAAFSTLRNQIAHCRWQNGDRPHACRPVGIDIRSGTVKWIVKEDSRDWTPDELVKEADKIANINERLQRLMEESGMRDNIMRKDDDKSRSMHS